ncbi:hypothetical protein ACFSCV_04855 [Methylopila henanensis]|uniref:Uncharacterized protein n=1 Tax=Methylopila henanensis TaxID=873516 RepID=A0ABW4K2E7_9HYPH
MAKTSDTRVKFKTRWYHRHPKYWFRKDKPRPAGHRDAPEVVRLDPEPGVTPSPKPPVRIFLGTEPMQARAERVFIWSVVRRRDPARAYEIHLMKDLKGFDRNGWTTGFTNYRYAIPALAGEQGRAIYNDVDQIYLADPAEMFDLDMKGAGILCVQKDETSVSLLDCARMAPHWRIEEARTPLKRKHFLDIIAREDLWGELPGVWNARDTEYGPDVAKCFHFTTLRTQPWRPFPDQLFYEDHPEGECWFALERSSNDARFNGFTRERPSRGFAAALAALGQAPRADAARAAQDARKLAQAAGAASVLVVSPEGDAQPDIRGASVSAARLDETLRAGANRRADGVLCVGGLSGLPEEDVAWALDALFDAGGGFLAVSLKLDPARIGTAAALPPEWWRLQLELASARAPDRLWSLAVTGAGSAKTFRGGATASRAA